MEQIVGPQITLNSIGIFHSEMKNPYDLPRQPDDSAHLSCIELYGKQNFEQALDSLELFDRIWVIYHFHHNNNWNPMTLPPRGSSKKIGIFSTRSPYRPNPLGLSCLKLIRCENLKLWVEGADLMDQTPILDIKPYLPSHDSFPDASMGWLKNIDQQKYKINFSEIAEKQLLWLRERGEEKISSFILRQLEYEPTNSNKKRVNSLKFSANEMPANSLHGLHTLAYRTWRVDFSLTELENVVNVIKIRTGYSSEDLNSEEDKYNDKELHRLFIKT